MKPSRREGLLIAITKARGWADELASGRLASFAVLARREGRAERHIRLLLPLAFVSPRVVSSILEGTGPAGLTITRLARALPWSWAEQERRLALPSAEHSSSARRPSTEGCMR
jgi:site-specific DNA recombinase